ncbi:MAG: prephenate dehydrogenase [Ignavibacteriales bacterium]|nr:prephenate dehydrogenase [Ignavibacteriales bacterium]
MIVTIIGTGLIGGSFALSLKDSGFASEIIGVDNSELHLKIALEKRIIDKALPLEEAIAKCNVVIIAIPVDSTVEIIPAVLDKVTNQTVIDVGSTKHAIFAIAKAHKNGSRFVATHPIWGTEYSGPDAAISGGMKNRITVICNPELSDPDAVATVETLYRSLGMRIVYQDAQSHDLHAAYVSHISHLTSFALALAVLDKEKEEEQIFQLAGGGFESTVRLAKSNPDTWVPIFKENRSNVLDVLNDQIHYLKQMKKLIEMEEYETLHKLLEQANDIKRILK